MLIAFALASSGFIAALLLIEAENRITSWIYSFINMIIGSNDSRKIEFLKKLILPFVNFHARFRLVIGFSKWFFDFKIWVYEGLLTQ